MTSSLVGSEMCIRDRLVEAIKNKAGGTGKVAGGKAGGTEKAAGRKCYSCLLYTSDAADDM
eukprot:2563144-Prorocentrum_lima.AAC.1